MRSERLEARCEILQVARVVRCSVEFCACSIRFAIHGLKSFAPSRLHVKLHAAWDALCHQCRLHVRLKLYWKHLLSKSLQVLSSSKDRIFV